MILFHLLNKLKNELSIKIGIFHLNHLLRGKDSDDDEKFVISLAKKYSTPIFVERYDFNENRISGKSFEEQAREVRYSLMQKIANENGYDTIATAHNSDDNIETVLMRIFKGTGVFGLKGINLKRDNLIRPILFLSVSEIYGYLNENKIAWREDRSNQKNDYDRNYLRNKLIPEIKTRFPAASYSIEKLSINSRETLSFVDQIIEEKLKNRIEYENNNLQINVDGFIYDSFFIHEVLAKYIRKFSGKNIFKSLLDEIYKNLMRNRANLNLYSISGLYIKKKTINGKIYIVFEEKIKKEIEDWCYEIDLEKLKSEKEIYISEIEKKLKFLIVDYDYFEKNRTKCNINFISLSKQENKIKIRNRLNGDRIILENGTKKIKNLFIENKISNENKDFVPIVDLDLVVVAFLPGVISPFFSNRISKNFKVSKESEIILAIFR